MSSADEIDRATDLAHTQNENAIATVRNAARPEQVKGPDGKWHQTHCEDCEEKIPPARLKLGKIRCIDCQKKLERRRTGL